MAWPTAQIPDSSAALAWQTITSAFIAAKNDIAALGANAALTGASVAALRIESARIKVWIDTAITANGVAGLQAYGRTYIGNPLFDLSVEFGACRTALKAVLGEVRALHALLAGDIAADGTVTPPRDSATVQECANLIAACSAFVATVQ